MALNIDFDLVDSFITEQAFSVIDGLARRRDPAEFVLTNVWTPPGNVGMTLQPVQLTSAWGAATGKLQLTNFTALPTLWEQYQRRAAGDWFIASRGNADAAAVSTLVNFPVNAGICLEFYPFHVPGTVVRDLIVMQFGQWFKLHVHTTGTFDFEDTRPINAQGQAGTPLLVKDAQLDSGGDSLPSSLVQVFVLPWRRGRVLVWSNLGGYKEVYLGCRLDVSDANAGKRTPGEPAYYVTTESAPVSITCNATVRAYWQLSQLRYPSTGSLKSPQLTLPYAVANAPIGQRIQAERQDGTTATLTITDQNGASFAPTSDARATALTYTVALTSPAVGVAPVVWQAGVDFDRQLGTREYETSGPFNPIKASLTLSRDRSQKSFSFTLDNPGDAFTSLKDLWNRRMSAYLTVDSVDPIAETIFVGYSDPAEFKDGVASNITIPCTGLRKKLRQQLLSDSRSYDGMLHTDAVAKLLHEGGIDDADMVIQVDTAELDSADPGEDPLWRPANGTSRDEFIQHIADTFSGWVFDDIGGKFYYVPKEYFTAAAIADNGSVPQVLMTTPLGADGQTPLPGTRAVNSDYLLAQNVKQTSEEPRANDLWVLGRDSKTDQIVAAHYEDDASISDRTAANYVGERQLFIYASASITSLAMAQRALSVLAAKLTQPVRRVTFSLPDYQFVQLPLEGPIYLVNYGVALVVGVSADLSVDRNRQSEYTVEMV